MKIHSLSLALLVHGSSATLEHHPVRSEIVEEIKALTSRWTPQEVHKNHFYKMPKEDIALTLGSLEAGTPAQDLKTKAKSPEPSLLDKLLGSWVGIQSYALNEDSNPWPENLQPHPAKEYLRPRPLVKGDPKLPSDYNVRDAFPKCDHADILNQ